MQQVRPGEGVVETGASEQGGTGVSLRYARRRRPLVRRRYLVVLAAMFVAYMLWSTVGEMYIGRAMYSYWQEKCLDYSQPGDRVAYVAAPRRLALPPYLADFSLPQNDLWNGMIAAPPYPIELAEVQKQAVPQLDIDWDKLPAPVFLHGLTDSGGHRRLVTVYALVNNPPGWWTLFSRSRDLSDREGPANAVLTQVDSTACWPLSGDGDTLVVFAGQADPSNASRFTLRYHLNHSGAMLTGMLLPDGQITFTSSGGNRPWTTARAGALVEPKLAGSIFDDPGYDPDRLILPTD